MQNNHPPSAAFAPGKHFLIDFYGAQGLSNVDSISDILEQAAVACGATVLNTNLHSFGLNAGVTGVALLAESHISIHTWPERKYAAIDIFMCGDCDPELALEPLCAYFTPSKFTVAKYQRGNEQKAENEAGFANTGKSFAKQTTSASCKDTVNTSNTCHKIA